MQLSLLDRDGYPCVVLDQGSRSIVHEAFANLYAIDDGSTPYTASERV